MREIVILSEEVLADLRSAGWLESELHPELDRQRRHQIADICEEGNVERVWRVLGVAVAEIRIRLGKVLLQDSPPLPRNVLERWQSITLRFRRTLAPDTLRLIKEKTHEYLVARVMRDRTADIIPEASGIWKERAETALSALDSAGTRLGGVSAARRPLWPL